jgi:hypothetical protein
MTWYAANIIMYTHFKDGVQDYYPVFENIILIEAINEKEAYKKALARAKLDEGDSSGTYYYDDRQAKMICAGIRKITTCEDPEKRPTDGTEITYSEFRVDSKENLSKLVTGDSVYVYYED